MAIKELYRVGIDGYGGTNNDGERLVVTPLVKVQALKELAALTKPPEEATINLKVSQSEAMVEAQHEANALIERLITNQEKAFKSGQDVSELQKLHVNVTDVEVE